MCRTKRLRQAVVIVHGMGEQRPLEMLNNFIDAAIPGATAVFDEKTGNPVYHSRPDPDGSSFETRFYLARGTDRYPQTDFYEYHWAHMMQGNRLSDLWETFLRVLLQPPWKVPSGLRVVWLLFWGIIAGAAWYFWQRHPDDQALSLAGLITALTGGGALAAVMTWLATKFIPGKITASFVDVVRYLDTSPRSYAVRRNIRKGMIEFLQDLHAKQHDGSPRYQRIVVVAHSLGAYVAYDGITYLWTLMNQQHDGAGAPPVDEGILKELEAEAEQLLKTPRHDPARYRALQRKLWLEFARHGNPWRITDFVTAGTPMYMAHLLMTKNLGAFTEKVDRREYAVCPPKHDQPGGSAKNSLYTYAYRGGTVLYHAAPFALVRWSNMWFPARLGFFGDWFGGPLKPLFGAGIKDVALNGNGWRRFLPAWAHALYFSFPDDESDGSATGVLQDLTEIDCRSWLAADEDGNPVAAEPARGNP